MPDTGMPDTGMLREFLDGAARARDAGWAYREIGLGHDPQVFDAEGIARLLIELAAPVSRA